MSRFVPNSTNNSVISNMALWRHTQANEVARKNWTAHSEDIYRKRTRNIGNGIVRGVHVSD